MATEFPQQNLGMDDFLFTCILVPTPQHGNEIPTSLCRNFIPTSLKGVPKKTSLNLRSSFCLISLSKNMLEGWDIIYLKGEIHCSIWNKKKILYNKRESIYKQTKSRFFSKKIWDNVIWGILVWLVQSSRRNGFF